MMKRRNGKIEIISDITYKYGKPILSESFINEDTDTSSKYYLPGHSSIPITPYHLKSPAIVVKDLTPTFRNLK